LVVVPVRGSKAERLDAINEDRVYFAAGGVHLVLTTYEALNTEQEFFRRLTWQTLVIDEAHRIKANATQLRQAIDQIKCGFRLMLTGTHNKARLLRVSLNLVVLFAHSYAMLGHFGSDSNHVLLLIEVELSLLCFAQARRCRTICESSGR
jgi:hypothetical protein